MSKMKIAGIVLCVIGALFVVGSLSKKEYIGIAWGAFLALLGGLFIWNDYKNGKKKDQSGDGGELPSKDFSNPPAPYVHPVSHDPGHVAPLPKNSPTATRSEVPPELVKPLRRGVEKPFYTKKAITEFRKSGEPYIVLDVETSGFSPTRNEIIEIAMVRYQEGEEVNRFTSLVKPSFPISGVITRVTGLTNDDLKDAPSFDDIADSVVAFIGEDVIVAHNASFDTNFLCTALGDRSVQYTYIDTLALARNVLPDLPNHKLKTLMKHYGISEEQKHRALDDVFATNIIFEGLCNDFLMGE